MLESCLHFSHCLAYKHVIAYLRLEKKNYKNYRYKQIVFLKQIFPFIFRYHGRQNEIWIVAENCKATVNG